MPGSYVGRSSMLRRTRVPMVLCVLMLLQVCAATLHATGYHSLHGMPAWIPDALHHEDPYMQQYMCRHEYTESS